MKQLPEKFLERMRELLGDEYEAFVQSYERPAQRGIRLNLRRLSMVRESGHSVSYASLVRDWNLTPLPESTCMNDMYREFILDEGWLLQHNIRPGKHPYHEAGLYYLQEPSAMQVVEQLDIRPCDRVLDLCAAPGGKSTQAADLLDPAQGGFIVANEYVGKRAQILSSNFERLGIGNGIVLNEDTGRLAKHFPAYFTRIIVDAPCSGEGMFRKDDTAIQEWSEENVALCVKRQREILENAAKMLSPGGKLSYSTCTFERCENEDMVDWFLDRYRDFSLVRMERLWPHKTAGEGHFLAIFKRNGEVEDGFVSGTHEEKRGERLYEVPNCFPSLKGLHVLRCGLELGTELKNRFEPSHASSHAADLRKEQAVLDLSCQDLRTEQYLRGLQIPLISGEDIPSGWISVAVDGIGLGCGKVVGGQVKNHFPKGLRWV